MSVNRILAEPTIIIIIIIIIKIYTALIDIETYNQSVKVSECEV